MRPSILLLVGAARHPDPRHLGLLLGRLLGCPGALCRASLAVTTEAAGQLLADALWDENHESAKDEGGVAWRSEYVLGVVTMIEAVAKPMAAANR